MQQRDTLRNLLDAVLCSFGFGICKNWLAGETQQITKTFYEFFLDIQYHIGFQSSDS